MNDKKKILFLSINLEDINRLRFDNEVHDLRNTLRRSRVREQFELHSEFLRSTGGLVETLLRYQPHIVHFFGHWGNKGLMFEDRSGFTDMHSLEDLSNLFKIFSETVQCVILNGCYSMSQANAISEHIDYVIYMPREIPDKEASEFSEAFYSALGAGRSIEDSYKFGTLAIMDFRHDENTPLFFLKGKHFQKDLEKIENMTITRGVVKPIMVATPLVGFKVVVLEKINRGAKFITILNPDDQPLKVKSGIFSSPREYKCYAVSSDTDLNFNFETSLRLATQHQQINLKCTVFYYVESPRHIVLSIESDPLRRIYDEIERKLQQYILHSKLRVQQIQDDYYQIKDTILPYPTLNQLRNFAKDFGVIIKDVDITCPVPKKFLEPGKIEDDVYLKKETEYALKTEKIKTHEDAKENLQDGDITLYQQSMENLKHINALRDMFVPKIITQIQGTDLSISSPKSLMNEMDSKLEAFRKIFNKINIAGGDRCLAKKKRLRAKQITYQDAHAVAEIQNFPKNSQLQVATTYILQAGVLKNKPTGFGGKIAPIQLPKDANTVIDITIHAEDMQIEPNWIQSFEYNPFKETRLLNFELTPKSVGEREICVEYYYKHHWLNQIKFHVEVIKTQQPFPLE